MGKHRWTMRLLGALVVVLGALLLACDRSPAELSQRGAQLRQRAQVERQEDLQRPVRLLLTQVLKLEGEQANQLRIVVIDPYALAMDHLGIQYLCKRSEIGWQLIAFGDQPRLPDDAPAGLAMK